MALDTTKHIGLSSNQLEQGENSLHYYFVLHWQCKAWDICLHYVFCRLWMAMMSLAVSGEYVPKGPWICRMQQDKMNLSIRCWLQGHCFPGLYHVIGIIKQHSFFKGFFSSHFHENFLALYKKDVDMLMLSVSDLSQNYKAEGRE